MQIARDTHHCKHYSVTYTLMVCIMETIMSLYTHLWSAGHTTGLAGDVSRIVYELAIYMADFSTWLEFSEISVDRGRQLV